MDYAEVVKRKAKIHSVSVDIEAAAAEIAERMEALYGCAPTEQDIKTLQTLSMEVLRRADAMVVSVSVLAEITQGQAQ